MRPLFIKPFDVSDNGHRLTAEFVLDGQPRQVYFQCNDLPLHPSPEALLTLAILPAMRRGQAISAPGMDVSAQFMASLSEVQSYFHAWKSELSQIAIQGVTPKALPAAEDTHQALFFSGGVDSFYSLLTHIDKIKTLVVVHGFDIALSNTVRRQYKTENARRVGEHYKLRVVEVETNVTDWFAHNPSWYLAHGAALAAVGHLLAPHLNGLYLAASHGTWEGQTDIDKFHRGVHHKLDHLWSSEAIQFTNDGATARRIEKIALLAQDDFALQTLLVCNEAIESGLNCCRCSKCLRTMVGLSIMGVLDRCPTFPDPLDLDLVAGTILVKDSNWGYVTENLEMLESSGRTDPALESALRRSLENYPKGKRLRTWKRLKRAVRKMLVGN